MKTRIKTIEILLSFKDNIFKKIEEHVDLTKISGQYEVRVNADSICIGTFDVHGKLQGHGVLIWLDNGRVIFVQQGEFRNGLLFGEGMTYSFRSRMKYIGEYVNDCESGMGKRLYEDGRYYEGYWKRGNRNGLGKFVSPDGTTYEGFWVDGFPNGFGKLTYADGRVEEGIFADGKFIGKNV